MFQLKLVMHYSQWHEKEPLIFTSGLKPDLFALPLQYTHAEMIIIGKKVDPKPTDICCLCSRYKLVSTLNETVVLHHRAV